MKKLLSILILVNVYTMLLFIKPVNYLSHQNFELINSNFVSLNLLDARDLSNTQFYQNDILKQLFVETIYIHFILDELESFKSITVLLLKKFVNFWFVAKVVNVCSEKIYYLLTETRKYFSFNYKFLFNLVLSIFALLFYFKTHLKTFKFTSIILRC